MRTNRTEKDDRPLCKPTPQDMQSAWLAAAENNDRFGCPQAAHECRVYAELARGDA